MEQNCLFAQYPVLLLVGEAEPPANLIAVAHETFDDVTGETIDLLYIAELSWAET